MSTSRMITKSKLILCEGASDKAFLSAIMADIQCDNAEIWHTGEANQINGRGGVTKFGQLLTAAMTTRGFEKVTDILIVADSDHDPAGQFSAITSQIAETANETASPPSDFVAPVRCEEASQGCPSITVTLLPAENQPGNLEALCVSAARAVAQDKSECVDNFINCINAADLPNANRNSKLTLRAFILAQLPKNPDIPISKIWEDNATKDIVPVSHDVFAPIKGILRNFLG